MKYYRIYWLLLLCVVIASCESRSGRRVAEPKKLSTLLVITSVEIKDYRPATALFKVKIVGSPGVYLYQDSFLFVKGDTIVQSHPFISTFAL